MGFKSFLRFFMRAWRKIAPISKKRTDTRNARLLVEMLERRDLLAAPPTILSSSVLPLDGSTVITGTPTIRIAYSESMGASAINASNYVLLGASGNPVTIDSAAFVPGGVAANSLVELTYNGGAPGLASAQLVVDSYTLFVKGDRLFDVDDNLPMAQPGQLIVANNNRNNISVVGLPGDGTLGAISDYNIASVGTQPPNTREVGFADLDADGIKDLIVVNAGTGQVMAYLGQKATDGGGYDTTPTITLNVPVGSTPATVNRPKTLVLDDLNKDGKIDIAISNQLGSTTIVDNVSVFLNTTASVGTLTFAPGTTTIDIDAVVPTTPVDAAGLAAGDFDGDGNVDLAVLLNTAYSSIDGDAVNDYRVAFLAGDGAGGFTIPAAANTPYLKLGDANTVTAGTIFTMDAAQIAGDGKKDIIIGMSGGMTGAYVYRNISTAPAFAFTIVGQSFDIRTQSAITITSASNPGNSTALTTITTSANHGYADGDVVTISGVSGFTGANGAFVISNASGMTFRLNGTASSSSGNGSGGTVTRATVFNPGGSATLTTVTTQSPHGINVGDIVSIAGVTGVSAPSGNFTVAAVPTTTTFTLAGTTSSTVSGGQGGTATIPTKITNSGVKAITTGNVNGDANTDIILTTTAATNAIELLRHDGGNNNPNFFIASSNVSAGAAGSVAVGDLDNNGRDDIIVSNGAAAGQITVFRNDSIISSKIGTIASITATGTADIVITTNGNHNLTSGDDVFIHGVTGLTGANGLFTIGKINDTTFRLLGTSTISGTATNLALNPGQWSNRGIASVSGTGGTITVTTTTNHGLATGDKIVLSGVAGYAAAKGAFTVTVVNATTFTVSGAAGAANGNIDTVSRAGNTVTVTTGTNHNLSNNDFVTITGIAGLDNVNGTFQITVTGPTTFTYTSAGTLAGSASGSIASATRVVGNIASAVRAGNTVTITTTAAHGLTSGDPVTITSVAGLAGVNGTYNINVTGANTFTITSTGAAGTATPSTGQWGMLTFTTSANHNLVTGDNVTITGVTGLASVDGAYAITVTGATTFKAGSNGTLAAGTSTPGTGTWAGTAAAAWNGTKTTASFTSGQSANISSASRTGNTVTITTSAAHGYVTGDRVTIAGVVVGGGVGAMDGTFTITVTGNTTFTYQSNGGAGSATANTGTASNGISLTSTTYDVGNTPLGVAVSTTNASGNISAVSGAGGSAISVTTSGNHGLASGAVVKISGVAGFAAADGVFTVAVTDATHFTLNGTSAIGAANGSIASTALNVGNIATVARTGGNLITVTTASAHNLANGATVTVAGTAGFGGGGNNPNGTFVVTVVDGTTFTYIDAGTNGTGTPATGTFATVTVTTTANHNLLTNDRVNVAGTNVTGTTGAVTITRLSATTFSYGTSSTTAGSSNAQGTWSGTPSATWTAINPADTSQDGLADVVVGNNLTSAVTLMPGNGDGTLKTGANLGISGISSAYGIKVVDVNGDNIPDLVSFTRNSSTSQSKVIVRQGQQGGTYGPEFQFNANLANLTAIVVADITGDGKPDIIVTSLDDKFSRLKNTMAVGANISASSFDNSLGTRDTLRDPYDIQVGDFNEDGAIDLAIAHNGSGGGGGGGSNRKGVQIFFGALTAGVPNGTFPTEQNFIGGTPIESVIVGDFNKDGHLDFIGGENAAPGNIHVHYGDGAGNFTNGGTFATGVPNISSLLAVDMNGDSYLDVVVASRSTNLTNAGIAILFNQFGTGFGTAVQSDVVPGTGINSILANDVNQDGFLDIVAATTLPKSSGSITNLANNGSNQFRITSNNHGLSTGMTVTITGSTVAAINGTWTITVPNSGGPGPGSPDPNKFDLTGPTPPGPPAFVSGSPGAAAVWNLAGNFTLNDNVFVMMSNGNGTVQGAVPYQIGSNPLQVSAPSFLAATPSSLIRVTTFTSGGTIVRPNLVTNGDFEGRDLNGEVGNLLGWQSFSLQGQTGGSQGEWRPQTGTASPLSGETIPVPSGKYRGMLDEADLVPITGNTNPNNNIDYAGTHVFYQDVTLPANASAINLALSLFIDNAASTFSDTSLTNPPGSLDYRTPQANQQVRVDIMRSNATMLSINTTPLSTGAISDVVGAAGVVTVTTSSAHNLTSGQFVEITGVTNFNQANGLFRITVTDATHFTLNGVTTTGDADDNTGNWSVPGDVLKNVFQTTTATSQIVNVSLGTGSSLIDLTPFAGQTVRLRVASANNQGKLMVGVDNVKIFSKFSDTSGPSVNGLAISNPSYIDNLGFAHTNDPTIIGRINDNGGVGNISYIEIDPEYTVATAFTSPKTVKITQWDVTGNFIYKLPTVNAGYTTVGVRAVDRANNMSTSTLTFYMQANSVTEWEPVGPQGIDVTGQSGIDYTKVSGRVTAILPDSSDPTGNTYYIGSANGGVWRTTNGGATWVSVMNTLTDASGSPIPVSIGGIAQSTMEPINPANLLLGYQQNKNIFYAATGVGTADVDSRPGVGILKSTDHGATWNVAGNSGTVLGGTQITSIVVDANNPNVAYVAVAKGVTQSVAIASSTTVAISTATNPGDGTTSTTVTTSAAHGLTTGDVVTITGVSGFAGANGSFVVTVTGTTTFTLNNTGSATSGSGTGGTVAKSTIYNPGDNTTLTTVKTQAAHGLAVGNNINISGVTGFPGGNGSFTVAAVIDTTTFTLTGTASTTVGGAVNGSVALPTSTGPGVYKTTDGGLRWVSSMNPTTNMTSGGSLLGNVALGSITSLVIDPANSNRLLAGMGNIGLAGDSSAAGLWLSTNNGGSWSRVLGGDSLSPPSPLLPVPNSTLPSGINLGRVTVAIGNTRTGNEGFVYVMIANKPTAGGNVPPSVDWGAFSGLYKSKDNMLNFTKVILREDIGQGQHALGGDVHNFVDINLFGRDGSNTGALYVDPIDPNVVYIGGSSRWRQATDPPNHSLIRVDTGNMLDTTEVVGGAIPNSGDDKTKAAKAVQRGGYYYYDGPSATFYDPYVAEGVFWYDLDQNGSSGQGKLNSLPEGITSLAVDAQGRLLVGTIGGIWRGVPYGFSYDVTSGDSGIMTVGFGGPGGGSPPSYSAPGLNFTAINGNLSISNLTSAAIDPNTRGVYYTTQIATGVAASVAPLAWVSQGLTGPTTQNGVNLGIPNAASILSASPAFGTPAGTPITLYRVWQYANPAALQPELSADNGTTWQSINSTGISVQIPAGMFPAFAINPTPVFLNGQYRNQLMFGTQVVYVSETDGTVWDQKSPVLSSGSDISALAFAPSTSGVLYAATTDGKVFYTNNAGLAAANWPQRNTSALPAVGTPRVYVKGISVDPNDSNRAYIMYAGAGNFEHVYVTTDAGVSWSPLGSQAVASGGLPRVPAYAMVIDKNASLGAPNGKLYLATEVGVFFSLDNGSNWARLGAGMPNVPVVDLKLDTDKLQPDGSTTVGLHVLAAATLGRGLYTINTAGFSFIPDKTIDEDTPTPAIPVTINNPANVSYQLSAVSNNSNLIASVVVGGSGNERTIQVTPVLNANDANAGGPATITVTLVDTSNPSNPTPFTYQQTFKVSVTPVNDKPTISPIGTQEILVNTSTGVLNFTVGDVETPAASISVTASSANQVLVPNANIVVGGAGANRTITVTPAPNQVGNAQITIRADDGTPGGVSTYTFDLLVTQAVNLDPATGGGPFLDDFNRANNTLFFGPGWQQQSTIPNSKFDIVNNRASATGVGPNGALALNVVSLKGLNEDNLTLQAEIITNPSFAGIVARYAGNGVSSFYLANISPTSPTAATAQIWLVQNGSITGLLAEKQNIASTNGTGTMRFEVVGESLKLYYNNALGADPTTLVLQAYDSRLTSGTAGFYTVTGTVYDNFKAYEVDVGDAGANYTAGFRTPSVVNGNQLSRDWLEHAGNVISTSDTAAQSNSAGLNLVTVAGYSENDVSVQTNITFNNANAVNVGGLVARYSGSGGSNMYYAALAQVSGLYYAQLWRNVGGAWTLLIQQNVAGGLVTPGALMKFEVIKDSLKFFVGGTLVAYANDSAITGPGSVGFRGYFAGDTYANFQASQLAQPAAVDPYNGYRAAVNTNQLSRDWVEHLGNFTQTSATSATVADAGTSLATVRNYSQADVSVEANVTLNNANATQIAALVARYQGSGGVGDTNMYFAALIRSGGNYFAQIWRNVGGVWTTLITTNVASGLVTPGVLLRFEAIGDSLKFFVGGTLVAYKSDTAITGAGSVGIRGYFTGDAYANFKATALTAAAPAEPYNGYGTAANTNQLSREWVEHLGNFTQTSATSATVADAGTSLATVRNYSQADVSVEANVTLNNANATQIAALVARYQGSGGVGDTNMYFAALIRSGGNYFAQIWRNVGGVWTTLITTNVASGLVTPGVLLRFEAIGDSLKFFVGGTLVAYKSDTAITGAGSVGIRGYFAGDAYANFKATALPAAAPPATYTGYGTAANTNQLSREWVEHSGNFTQTSGTSATTADNGFNLATVRGYSQTNVSVKANVTVNGANTQQVAGLVARYQGFSGFGDGNMYYGAIVLFSGQYYAQLWKNVGGVWTILNQQTFSSGLVTAGALVRFDVIGDSLKLLIGPNAANLTAIAFANDTAITGAGSVGIRGYFAGDVYANFASAPIAAINETLTYDVTTVGDGFQTPSNGTQLSRAWREEAGNFTATSDTTVVANGSAASLATLNGVSTADVTLTVDITFSAATSAAAGLVARHTGSGDSEMYYANLSKSGSSYSAQLWRNKGGVWTLLASASVPSGPGNGPRELKFTLTGTALQVHVDGALTLNIVDSGVNAITGAGRVGLRGFFGDTYADFLAS